MEEVESKKGSYGVLVSLTVSFSSQYVCAVIVLDHSCFMAKDRCQQQRPHPAQLFFLAAPGLSFSGAASSQACLPKNRSSVSASSTMVEDAVPRPGRH